MPETIEERRGPAVREAYGPTLPALLTARGWSRRWQLVLLVVVLAVAAALAFSYSRRDHRADTVYIHRDGLAWNVRYGAELKRVAPTRDETFRLERRTESGRFVQAFAVSPLDLPGSPGELGGVLPVEAAPVIDRLRSTYQEFELVSEGKTRINEAISYNISFRARLGPRRLFGRAVIVPEQVRQAKRAQLLVIEATPAAGVSNVREVGVRGVTKRPYRSFRLGTEPGGVAPALAEPEAPESVTD